MSAKEIDRFAIMTSLAKGQINGSEAAEQLDLTPRQVRRIKKRFKEKDPKSIIHQSRGREGNNKLKQAVVKKILELLLSVYIGFGPTLAAEKLSERDKIEISDESLRTIMVKNNLWKSKPRKKNNEHREWRPRWEHYGSMEQYDGCYHHWFEDRATEVCLLLAVDDATGQITKAQFDKHEGVIPTFSFWKAYVEEKGKPTAIYLDKFSTYKINHKAAQDNKELVTQFQRACLDLGIRLIFAHSPEAKGRVEKMFRTLQDRLVKELRLQNISNIQTANKFLEEVFIPDFNKKFAVVPAKRGNLHRPLTETDKQKIDDVFSVHSTRVVMNDFTVQFKNQYFQLKQQQPVTVFRKDSILVEEHLNGSITLKLRSKNLEFLILPKRPEKVCAVRIPALTTAKPTYKPPANHPWRKQFILNQTPLQTVQ